MKRVVGHQAVPRVLQTRQRLGHAFRVHPYTGETGVAVSPAIERNRADFMSNRLKVEVLDDADHRPVLAPGHIDGQTDDLAGIGIAELLTAVSLMITSPRTPIWMFRPASSFIAKRSTKPSSTPTLEIWIPWSP